MRRRVLLDTGPLVAYFNRREKHHEWAVTAWQEISPPLLTCEAVISEACFLLQSRGGASQAVLDLVSRGGMSVAFAVADHAGPISRLMAKYSNIPMSLADACLVRMAELHPDSAVLTLDSDFNIYRKNGRQVIPTIMPSDL